MSLGSRLRRDAGARARRRWSGCTRGRGLDVGVGEQVSGYGAALLLVAPVTRTFMVGIWEIVG